MVGKGKPRNLRRWRTLVLFAGNGNQVKWGAMYGLPFFTAHQACPHSRWKRRLIRPKSQVSPAYNVYRCFQSYSECIRDLWPPYRWRIRITGDWLLFEAYEFSRLQLPLEDADKKGGGDTRKYVNEWFDLGGGSRFSSKFSSPCRSTRGLLWQRSVSSTSISRRLALSVSVLVNWHCLPRPWFPKSGPVAKRSQVGQAWHC